MKNDNLPMKSNYLRIIIALCLVLWIADHLTGQMSSHQQQISKAKSVVLAELELRNDPNFIARGHHQANVTAIRTRTLKKNYAPRLEYPVPATEVKPLLLTPDVRRQTYEFPCVSYLGLITGGSIPPDVSGAVGFDHLMLTENDSFRVMTKNGNTLFQQLQQDATGLWSGLYNVNLFDPKIIYDPYNHRWIHVILSDSRTPSSSLLVAVSNSSDPLGSWEVWVVDADAENDHWLDYPSVGFNNKWLVVNGLMAAMPGSSASQESRTFIFDLQALYNSNTVNLTIFSRTDYKHIAPALTYDPNFPDIWCITNDDVDDNDLRFFKISGPTGFPELTEEGYISISPDWGQGGEDIAPQLGSGSTINAADHRLAGAIWRSGVLYAVQTIFLPDGGSPNTCTIQYVAADPNTETIHESIRFASDASSMYAFPNIAVNANQDIIISCGRFTATTYPSAAVLVRRNGSSDWTQTTFKSGEDWYALYDGGMPARNRWGDYTMAFVDPSDDQSVWVSGEYSLPRNGTNGRWATWIAKICSDICETVVNVNTNPPPHTMKKYEAFDLITATAVLPGNSSIKLDAGNRIVLQPGFKATAGARFRAFIEGCTGAQ